MRTLVLRLLQPLGSQERIPMKRLLLLAFLALLATPGLAAALLGVAGYLVLRRRRAA